MDIKVNRIDQIKTALNQQNDNFSIHTKAQIYYLKSTDIMCFERNLQISDPDEQVYFYRCMSVEEAWQWVSTWRRDTMDYFKCWNDPNKSLSLASYFGYCYNNKYFQKNCAILEFYAPDFIKEIRAKNIVTGAKSEDGDMSWSIGQNCTSGHGTCYTQLKNELPKIFFENLLGIRLVAYKL